MTGSPDSLEQELLSFIRGSLCREPDTRVQPTSQLFADHIIDSINVLPLIGYVEARLGRRIEDDELVLWRFASVEAIMQSFFSGL
jgi:acyl carrier protein